MTSSSTINEDGRYEVLQSRYLVQRPWMTVRQDTVLLPNRRLIPDYYVLEYPDWVNIIAVTNQNDIVLERQYRHAIGKTAYELPGGIVEKGEEPLAAAKRELLEETGFDGGEWQLLMVGAPNPGTMNNLCYSYLAVGVDRISGQQLDSTEELTVHLFKRKDVLKLMYDGEIIHILHSAPLWKYFCCEDI